MEDESQDVQLLAEANALDEIESRIAPLQRSVQAIFFAAAAGFLGFLFRGELGADLGYTIFWAATFALFAGILSIPWLRKLRRLKPRREALLLSRGEMSEFTAELDSSLERLSDAIRGARVRSDHLFPDLALLGLARDVFEHGTAVRVLWDSDVPRSCYSPARSAFEACQEVMFLGTRTDDYDYWGARARARELMDWEYSVGLAEATGVGEKVGHRPTAEQLAEDADLWDGFSPGKGDLLHAAMADVATAKGPGRHHWTGMTRAKLPAEFMEATGGDEESIAIHRSMYNLLSLHSHPSPRIEVRSLRFEEGVFSFTVSGDADEMAGAALAMTYVAVVSAAAIIENMFRGVGQ